MQLSLDPEKEQDLIDKLEEWENFDNRLKNQERQSMAILKRLHEQEGRTDTHEATMINHEVDMQDVKHDVGVVKEDVKCIAAKADRLTTGLEKVEKASEAMQADQGKNT